MSQELVDRADLTAPVKPPTTTMATTPSPDATINIDGFDVPLDVVKQQRQLFLDEYFFRRMRLVEQALALLQGYEHNGELVSRTHISSNCESILRIGLFTAQHISVRLAATLLIDSATAAYDALPYIFVIEYSMQEYASDLDPPEQWLRLRKRCFLAQTSSQVTRHETHLLNSKRRFVIDRGWVADTRRWASYVLPGPGGPVSSSSRLLHHLDPELCAPHHWIDDFDVLFQESTNGADLAAAREQRGMAVRALLGVSSISCSCQLLQKGRDHKHKCTKAIEAPTATTTTTTTTPVDATSLLPIADANALTVPVSLVVSQVRLTSYDTPSSSSSSSSSSSPSSSLSSLSSSSLSSLSSSSSSPSSSLSSLSSSSLSSLSSLSSSSSSSSLSSVAGTGTAKTSRPGRIATRIIRRARVSDCRRRRQKATLAKRQALSSSSSPLSPLSSPTSRASNILSGMSRLSQHHHQRPPLWHCGCVIN